MEFLPLVLLFGLLAILITVLERRRKTAPGARLTIRDVAEILETTVERTRDGAVEYVRKDELMYCQYEQQGLRLESVEGVVANAGFLLASHRNAKRRRQASPGLRSILPDHPRFEAWASDEEWGRAALPLDPLDRLARAVGAPVHLRVVPTRVIVEAEGSLRPHDVPVLLNFAREIHAHVRSHRMPEVAGAAATGGTAICQVCSTPIDRDAVRCASCATPHHRDCWVYLGRCSTYACGSKDMISG